jgi:hypothetical protein
MFFDGWLRFCSLQVTVIGNGIFFQIGKKEERIRRIIQAGWFVLCWCFLFVKILGNIAFSFLHGRLPNNWYSISTWLMLVHPS